MTRGNFSPNIADCIPLNHPTTPEPYDSFIKIKKVDQFIWIKFDEVLWFLNYFIWFLTLGYFQNESCQQNPNLTSGECNQFNFNKKEEIYYEYEMCVWDFATETIKTRFLVAKTIFGFILPLIIISISYFIIGIRKVYLIPQRPPCNLACNLACKALG